MKSGPTVLKSKWSVHLQGLQERWRKHRWGSALSEGRCGWGGSMGSKGRHGRRGKGGGRATGMWAGHSEARASLSLCAFFSPCPVSWERNVSAPPQEVWSSVHLNPLPAPRKAGHPSACCLGDAGDARAAGAGQGWAASCITENARPRSASSSTGLSPLRDPRCLPQGPPNSRSGGSTGEHGGSPPNTS